MTLFRQKDSTVVSRAPWCGQCARTTKRRGPVGFQMQGPSDVREFDGERWELWRCPRCTRSLWSVYRTPAKPAPKPRMEIQGELHSANEPDTDTPTRDDLLFLFLIAEEGLLQSCAPQRDWDRFEAVKTHLLSRKDCT